MTVGSCESGGGEGGGEGGVGKSGGDKSRVDEGGGGEVESGEGGGGGGGSDKVDDSKDSCRCREGGGSASSGASGGSQYVQCAAGSTPWYVTSSLDDVLSQKRAVLLYQIHEANAMRDLLPSHVAPLVGPKRPTKRKGHRSPCLRHQKDECFLVWRRPPQNEHQRPHEPRRALR